MTRQLILGISLIGVLGAGTATVLVHHSAAPARSNAGELCIVLAKDPGHHSTQDYCIDWSTVPLH